MKKQFVLFLMLFLAVGVTLVTSTAVETATWSGPEPSGIVANTN